MSPELITGLVSGFTAGGISISTIPLLFNGRIRFEREIIEAKAAAQERALAVEVANKAAIAVLAESGERQDRTIEKLESELREQYRINAEQAKELFTAVRYLQTLAGIARSDRRTPVQAE